MIQTYFENPFLYAPILFFGLAMVVCLILSIKEYIDDWRHKQIKD